MDLSKDEKYLSNVLESVFRPIPSYILIRFLWRNEYVLDKASIQVLEEMVSKGLIQNLGK